MMEYDTGRPSTPVADSLVVQDSSISQPRPSQNLGDDVESELVSKAEYDKVLHSQEDILAQLCAHKKTMVTALAGHVVSLAHPIPLEYSNNFVPVAIEGRYPLYIMNIGTTHGPDAMRGYKALRRFRTHRASRSTREEILYTTIVLGSLGQRYYIIKDDENNVWRGSNAFDHFKQAFPFQLPFSGIEDWLGLWHPEIRKYFTVASAEQPAKQAILDRYFGF